MTVEMVIKRLYFASAKKRRNCTFRFEKMYVSFSRLYFSSLSAAGASFLPLCLWSLAAGFPFSMAVRPFSLVRLSYLCIR